MQLEGKVALVTGAGRGIGRDIAIHLGGLGAAVALNYAHSQKGACTAAEQIRSAGGNAIVLQADVQFPAQVAEMVAQVVERLGRLDVLVNNSAIDPRKPFLEVTEEFWDSVIDTNLKGAFFCAQAAAREMSRKGRGRIINISSVHGQATMEEYSVYAASKGGMNALTRQLALDLAPWGITVNAVAPGCVQVEKSTYDPAVRGKEIPCGRVGHPRDISAVVGFLASDATDWLTGQVITVDGGSTTRLFLNVAALSGEREMR
jgi:glucose 1-dehydrogenase/3-oxoacyl-[acyl-carrier protein] reductase